VDEAFDSAFDEVLDRALRGDAPDVESVLRGHPDLTPEERRKLRSMAEVVSGDGDSPLPSDIPADEGLPFERLGEFRLVRRLGEGGMGSVYLAEQTSLRRLVALKVIRPDRADSPDAISRLRREAQTIARLRHPNIVTVFATGEECGVHFIAMELVPGQSLDAILREAAAEGRRLPPARVVAWMIDVARALQCVHDAGIVHRDVKPANVRITPEGRALLVDFGLVLETPPSAGAVTVVGQFRGTPQYASPEQIAANRIGIDARSDVYSLGVMLYECATGGVPFDGDTSEAILQEVLVKGPVPPRRANPAIPRDLETVILTAMEKDRDRRYPCARAMAEELQAVLELRPIVAKRAGPFARADKWVRRHPVAAAAVGVAAALAIAAGVVAWRSRARPELPAAERREAAEATVRAARQAFARWLDHRRARADASATAADVAEIVAEATRALSFEPANRDAHDVLADLAIEMRRSAAEAGDARALEYWSRELAEHDPDGRRAAAATVNR
jgi:tRNA A-37 threonylcarbamoyl transferase component Bud32